MENFTIKIVIALAILWLLILLMIYLFGGLGKSTCHKWVELTISYFTVVAIVAGGFFAYFKYDSYRRESNYQKVITRYLDNNIDVFTFELSSYSMNVSTNLELIKENVITVEERKKIFGSILETSEKLRYSLPKLMVFDPIVYRSYKRMINEITVCLYKTTHSSSDIESIENRKMIVENWSNFIIFNLQDIGELLRKNIYDYDTPNIEKIKEKDKYKEIITRFSTFNSKWDSMIEARNNFRNYRKNNESLQKSNPEQFEKESKELNNVWTSKTAELHNYVAGYLDERGIPTAKAQETY